MSLKKAPTFILLFLFFSSGFSLFAQTSLSFFLDAAGHNNPTTRLDSLQQLAARLSLEQQKAALTGPSLYAEGGFLAAPVLSTGNGNTRFVFNPSKSVTDYQGYDLALTNGGLYRGVVNLDQPLFTASRSRALGDQEQIQQAQLILHSRLSLHQLEKNVTDQYLLCQYTLRQQAVVHQLINLLRDEARVSEALAQKAILYQADVQLLTIETDRLNTNLFALEAAYSSQLFDLYVLCGIRDTTQVRIDSTVLRLTSDNNPGSVFTQQFHLDSLRLITDQALFNLRYKPQVSFFTSAGLNTSYAPDIPQRFGWQAGLRYTQIIFDGHQRRTIDRRSQILSQSSALQTGFFLDQNTVRKIRIRQQIDALDRQDSATRHQQASYDSLLVLYHRQVITGQLSVINYLTVLRSRATLQQDLAATAYNRDRLISEYNYWNW